MEYSTSFRHKESADLAQNLRSPAPTDQALGIKGLVAIIKAKKNDTLTQEAKQIILNSVYDVGDELKRAAISALIYLQKNGFFDMKSIVDELEVRLEKDPSSVIKALLQFKPNSENVLLRMVPRFGDCLLRLLLDENKLDIPFIMKVFFQEDLPEASKLNCLVRMIQKKELHQLLNEVAVCHKSLPLREFVYSLLKNPSLLYSDTLFQDDPAFVSASDGYQLTDSLEITTVAEKFISQPAVMATATPSPLLYGSAIEASVVLADVYKESMDEAAKSDIEAVQAFLARIELPRGVGPSADPSGDSLLSYLQLVLTEGTSDFLLGWLDACEKTEVSSCDDLRPAVSCLLGLLPSLSPTDKGTALCIIEKYLADTKYRPVVFYSLFKLQLQHKVQHPDILRVLVGCAYTQNAKEVANFLALIGARGNEQQKMDVLKLAASFCQKFPAIGTQTFLPFINFRGVSEAKAAVLLTLAESIIENHRDCSTAIMPIVDSLLASNDDTMLAVAVNLCSSLIGMTYLDFPAARQLISGKIQKLPRKTRAMSAYVTLIGIRLDLEDGADEIKSVFDELWENRFSKDQDISENTWNALAELFERGILPEVDLWESVPELLAGIREQIKNGVCTRQAARGISRFLAALIALDLPNIPTPAYTKDSSFATSSFLFAASAITRASKETVGQVQQSVALFAYEVRERFRSIAHAQHRDKLMAEFSKRLWGMMDQVTSTSDVEQALLLLAQWRMAISSLLDTSALEKSGEKRIDVFLNDSAMLLSELVERNPSPGVVCALNGLIMEIFDIKKKVSSRTLEVQMDSAVSVIRNVLSQLPTDCAIISQCSWGLPRLLGLSEKEMFVEHPDIAETAIFLSSEEEEDDAPETPIHRRWLYPVCAAFGCDIRFANHLDMTVPTEVDGAEVAAKLKTLCESRDLTSDQLDKAVVETIEQCGNMRRRDFFDLVDPVLKKALQKNHSDRVIQAVSTLATFCWGFDLQSNVVSDYRQLPKDRHLSAVVRFIFENCVDARSGVLLDCLVAALSPQRRPDGRTLPPFHWQRLYSLVEIREIPDVALRSSLELSFLRLAVQERIPTILFDVTEGEWSDEMAEELQKQFSLHSSSFLSCLSFPAAIRLFSRLYNRNPDAFVKELCESDCPTLAHPAVAQVIVSLLPRMTTFTAVDALHPSLKLRTDFPNFLGQVSSTFDVWVLVSELSLGEFSKEPIQELIEKMYRASESEREVMLRIWGHNFAGRPFDQLSYVLAGLMAVFEANGKHEGIVFLLFCSLVAALPSVIPLKWLGTEGASDLLMKRIRRSWVQFIKCDEEYRRLHPAVSAFLLRLLGLENSELSDHQISLLKFMLRSSFGRSGVPQKLLKDTPPLVWDNLIA